MSNQTFSLWDGSVASSFGGGTGTETDPYRINSAAQLAYLEKVFNDPYTKKNTYYGKYYKLTSNIDLDKREWNPIGDYKKISTDDFYNLAIHFDGDNHIVRGLYIDRPEEFARGLFGSVTKTSSFKNITIEDAYVSGTVSVAGLIGQFDSNYWESGIENCHFSGEIHGHQWVGGIVGEGGGIYLKDCTNTGTITTDTSGGGIAGSYSGWDYCDVVNCVNTGTITGNGIGGIVGITNNKTLFKYCQNSGNVSNESSCAGGITNGQGNFEYCSNSGNITTNTTAIYSYTGGITGSLSGGYLKNCYNSGTITAANNGGGLTGIATNATIESSTNTGTVNGTGWRTGGICGHSKSNIIVEYCTNEGTVNSSGRGYVGGIVGEGNHVKHCNNTGSVKGNNYVAGICGYSESEDSLIADCLNDGFIEAAWYGAGIAGYFKGTIKDCINMAPIQTNSTAAGIVCQGGIAVKNCYNTGSIAGSSSLGGIIYSTLVEGFLLEKNYNSGEIGSIYSSGGILGYLKHDGGQLIDCHYHAGSAQKGIGSNSIGVSIEATGYAESVVSADDPKTVPSLLTQSIMVNTLAVALLFWGKKKQQLLTRISKLVSISKSLGVGQDEEPLNEIDGNDIYLITEHSPVRETADPSSNIISMCFKKDMVKVLPQTRSNSGDYYRILTEENLVGLLPSTSLVPANMRGAGNTPYIVVATEVSIFKHPSRWCEHVVGKLNNGGKVKSVPSADLKEDIVQEDNINYIKMSFNGTTGTTVGWVQRSMIKEGSGQIVTQTQVNSFTWNGQYFGYHNPFDVAAFNDYLGENNVIDYKSIAMFMATIGAESDMGRVIAEGGNATYWESRGYNEQTKGAGLIQLTGKFDKANNQIVTGTAQDDFMNYIVSRGNYKTPLTRNDPSGYIVDNYPVESAVIYWSVKAIKNALGDSINDGIIKRLQTVQGTASHSVEDRIFLFTQYVVNGYIRLRNVNETVYNGLDISTDKLMREILYEGADYKIYSPNNKEDEYKIEFLTGNYAGYITNGPDIWNKRKEMYDTAKGIWN